MELTEAHLGPPLPGEGGVGDLRGGEGPVLIEERAQQPARFGEPAQDDEQPAVEAPAGPAAVGASRGVAMRIGRLPRREGRGAPDGVLLPSDATDRDADEAQLPVAQR